MDGQHPGSKLPDPQGVLSKSVPLRTISAANTEVALLQTSAADATIKGTYPKMCAEKKAEIGKCAEEHGVLASIR